MNARRAFTVLAASAALCSMTACGSSDSGSGGTTAAGATSAASNTAGNSDAGNAGNADSSGYCDTVKSYVSKTDEALKSFSDTSVATKGVEAIEAHGEKTKALFHSVAEQARSAADQSDGEVRDGWLAIAEGNELFTKPFSEWSSATTPSGASSMDAVRSDAKSKCGVDLPKARSRDSKPTSVGQVGTATP